MLEGHLLILKNTLTETNSEFAHETRRFHKATKGKDRLSNHQFTGAGDLSPVNYISLMDKNPTKT